MSTFLVTQASGRQSRYTVTCLLEAGAKIRAVLRDPLQVPQELDHPNVAIFKGDSTDLDAMSAAAAGCQGVYLNTFPEPGLETRQAKTITLAARKAGIQSVVCCTTLLADRRDAWDTDVIKDIGLFDYYSSKHEVEEMVRSAGFETYTILRPSLIHFDYLGPGTAASFPDLCTAGEITYVCRAGSRLPHTDGLDIGRLAAAALLNPTKFAGAEIDVLKGHLSPVEAAGVLSEVSGKAVGARKKTAEEEEAHRETVFFQKFHQLADVYDFKTEIESAAASEAKFGVEFTPFEESMRREKAALLATLPNQ